MSAGQAAQWAALGFGGALLYFIGGWLAQNSNLAIAFLISAIVPLCGLITTFVLLADEKKQRKTILLNRSLSAFWSAVKSRQLLAVIGFIACLEFTLVPPLVHYLISYYKDILRFDDQFIGILGSFEALANGLGALTFGIFAWRISRRLLLNLAVGLTAISTLGLLLIQNMQSAILVSVFYGFFAMIAMLGVLKLAARACPVGAEGTTYALLMSVYNLQNSPVPSWVVLYGREIPVSALVIVSAGFTVLC